VWRRGRLSPRYRREPRRSRRSRFVDRRQREASTRRSPRVGAGPLARLSAARSPLGVTDGRSILESPFRPQRSRTEGERERERERERRVSLRRSLVVHRIHFRSRTAILTIRRSTIRFDRSAGRRGISVPRVSDTSASPPPFERH